MTMSAADEERPADDPERRPDDIEGLVVPEPSGEVRWTDFGAASPPDASVTEPRMSAPAGYPKHERTQAMRMQPPEVPEFQPSVRAAEGQPYTGTGYQRRPGGEYAYDRPSLFGAAPRGRAVEIEPLPLPPHERAVESPVTKVARVFAIIRDAIFIVAVVFAVFAVVNGCSAFSNAVTRDPGVTAPAEPEQPLPCAKPTTDAYGTFCPDAPGG
jgi:hypothetical protein